MAPNWAGAQKHIEHHSPEATVFGSMPDVMGLREAYGTTALARLAADEGIQRALGGLTGEERLDPISLARSAYEEAVLAGDLPAILPHLDRLTALSFSVSMPEGGLVAGILSATSNEAVLEQWHGQIEMEFVDGPAASAAFNLLVAAVSGSGLPITMTQSSRVQVLSFQEGATGNPRVALFGSHVIALFGSEPTERLLGRLLGNEEGLTSSRLGLGGISLEASGTVFLEWLSRAGSPRSAETVSGTTPGAGEGLEAGLGMAAMAEALFGANLSMLLRGGHWRTVITGQGFFVTEGSYPQIQSASSKVLSATPLEGTALNLLPDDVMVRWASSLHKPSLRELVRGALGAVGQSDELGFEADLFEPLGTLVAVGLPKPKTLLSAPPVIAVVTLADAAQFKRGLDGLVTWAESQGLDWLHITQDEYRGKALFTVQADVPEVSTIPVDLGGFFRPCLAVLDDRAILTTLPNHTKRELRRALKEDGAEPVIIEGVPPLVTEVGQADWARFLGAVYGGAKAMASLGAAADLPVDPESLPSVDHLVSFFEPSLSWKTVTEGGVRMYQRSSFGPEFALLCVAAPVLFFSTERAPDVSSESLPTVGTTETFEIR